MFIKVYSLSLIVFIIFSVKLNYLNFDLSFNYLCLIMNIIAFINYFQIVGGQGGKKGEEVSNPSYKLIAYLEKNSPCSKDELRSYLRGLNLIEERIEILQKEKLLILQNNSLSITNYGRKFCSIFVFIQQFLGLKAEG